VQQASYGQPNNMTIPAAGNQGQQHYQRTPQPEFGGLPQAVPPAQVPPPLAATVPPNRMQVPVQGPPNDMPSAAVEQGATGVTGTANGDNAKPFDAFANLSVNSQKTSAVPKEEDVPPKMVEKEQTKYTKGDSAFYTDSNGTKTAAKIVKVHLDDELVPFYTILLPDGREKQTDHGHLTEAVETSDIQEIKHLLLGLSLTEVKKVLEFVKGLQGVPQVLSPSVEAPSPAPSIPSQSAPPSVHAPTPTPLAPSQVVPPAPASAPPPLSQAPHDLSAPMAPQAPGLPSFGTGATQMPPMPHQPPAPPPESPLPMGQQMQSVSSTMGMHSSSGIGMIPSPSGMIPSPTPVGQQMQGEGSALPVPPIYQQSQSAQQPPQQQFMHPGAPQTQQPPQFMQAPSQQQPQHVQQSQPQQPQQGGEQPSAKGNPFDMY
jgi:hypothetical protein